jgi:hypothetical protein
MYSSIMKFIKDYLAGVVNAVPVQTGFYGNFPTIDLRKAAILLEPKIDSQEAHSTVWNKGEFHVRLWILVAMDIDFLASMEEIESLLGAEDEQMEIFGLNAALKKMKVEPQYEALSGTMGGKRWRIGAGGLRTKGPTFSIQQRANGTKINVAQLDLFVKVETEK